ncbi:MAG: macro domain-containing protein, partial [Thermodesulfovibrionales bacterium]|nr:macro domain-containing protein [Thermodesulfovibrionales bacterium]
LYYGKFSTMSGTNFGGGYKVLVGDLFESECQTLVNTVNIVGIMGTGVALAFKKRFSDMFEDYVKRCNEGRVKLGEPYLYKRLVPPWILNFPTKKRWRSVSNLSDIIRGLKYLEQHYKEWGITSIALPPLGCGHGQLEWNGNNEENLLLIKPK